MSADAGPIEGVLFDHSLSAAEVIVEAARERGVSVDPRDAARLWDRLWAAGKQPEELAIAPAAAARRSSSTLRAA